MADMDRRDERLYWKVLVVDDDPEIASLVEVALGAERCVTAVAHDGRTAIRRVHEFQPDVILLDVKMPGMNGLEALRQIRRHWQMPILMVSAIGDEDAIVHCLDEGADDFVNKPFGLRELRARVRAALRRSGASGNEGRDLILVNDGELVIDVAAHQVFARGDIVELAPLEYKLLVELARNQGRVLTKDYLLRSVWGSGYEDAGDVLKSTIGRLRSRIELDPAAPKLIHSRWGVGYYLDSA